MAAPKFSTNLSQIENKTGLLCVGHTHDNSSNNLYFIRSLKFLRDKGYNTLILEQPEGFRKEIQKDNPRI